MKTQCLECCRSSLMMSVNRYIIRVQLVHDKIGTTLHATTYMQHSCLKTLQQ